MSFELNHGQGLFKIVWSFVSTAPIHLHGTGTSIFFLQPGYMTQQVCECYFTIRKTCPFFLSCAVCKYKAVLFLSLHNGCDYITMEVSLTTESDAILLGDGQC